MLCDCDLDYARKLWFFQKSHYVLNGERDCTRTSSSTGQKEPESTRPHGTCCELLSLRTVKLGTTVARYKTAFMIQVDPIELF